MRVISGIYKRRRFDVPHTFKARPTTDFAKENLFNVLTNYIDFEGIRLWTFLLEQEASASNWFHADAIVSSLWKRILNTMLLSVKS